MFLKIISRIKQLTYSTAYKKSLQLFKQEKFLEFIDSAQELEEKGQAKHDLYQLKAIAYFRLDQKKQATLTMQKNLEKFTNERLEDFIKHSQSLIFDNPNITSTYRYSGGYNNLGVIIHSDLMNSKQDYITKITENNTVKIHNIEKEIVFNDIIRKESPLLHKVTPELISSVNYHHKKLKLLTFEKKGKTLIDDFEIDFNKIIQLNCAIMKATSYDRLSHLLKEKQSEKFLSSTMAMHLKTTHEINFSHMLKALEKNGCSEPMLAVLDDINSLIVASKVYTKIKPSSDYVLCHGDFNPANITYDELSNNYFLIDWEDYGFSLKGYDLANYLAMTGLSFATIKKDFIKDFFPLADNTIIQRIFFNYQLLGKWVILLKKEKQAGDLNDKILPALEDLKKLVATLKKDDSH